MRSISLFTELRKFSLVRLVTIVAILAAIAACIIVAIPRSPPYSTLSPSSGEVPPEADSSSNWPHLRGPRYDAVSQETGLADSWPSEGPPVLWTREIGQGYSGFIVVDGKAYTQAQSLMSQSVLCLDAETGETIWDHRYDWPWQPASLYQGPFATPTYYRGKIYFAAPNGLVACLDADSGREIWSLNVVKKFAGKGTEFGYASTPCVEAGKVILPVGGKGASVVALDANDGSLVWGSRDDEASYCPALPITFRGQRIIIGYLRNVLVGIDLQTGQQLWRERLSNEYDEHSAWPLYAEPNLWVAFPFKAGSQLLRLERRTDAVSVRAVRIVRELSNDIFSSVLVQGHVYGFDLQEFQAKAHRTSRGQFRCLDWSTGKVCWTTAATGHANVLAADGKLILCNDTGALILARASAERYEELGRVQVLGGGLCWTAPSLSHRRLYMRNQARMACLYLGKPEDLRPEQREQAISAADIPASKAATWVARIVPREREYPFDAPTLRELWLWFQFSVVGVFGGALTLALVLRLLSRFVYPSRFVTEAAFWSSAFTLGLLGTTVFSAYWDTFVFTWPVALFVTYQVTVIAAASVGRRIEHKPRWVSRIVTLLFLVLCLAYYQLCKTTGIVMGWSFLIGLLPAFPFAMLTAWSQRKGKPVALQMAVALLAFAVFFWTSGLFVNWKIAASRAL